MFMVNDVQIYTFYNKKYSLGREKSFVGHKKPRLGVRRGNRVLLNSRSLTDCRCKYSIKF